MPAVPSIDLLSSEDGFHALKYSGLAIQDNAELRRVLLWKYGTSDQGRSCTSGENCFWEIGFCIFLCGVSMRF